MSALEASGVVDSGASVAPASSKHRSVLTTVGVVLVGFVVFAVAFGPLIWGASTEQQNLSEAFAGPSLAHPFGTDEYGRDLLARILAGGRVSLGIGIGSVLIALVLGLAGGIVAAVGPGWVNFVVLRVTDALLALPQIVLAVILVATLGFGMVPLLIALAVATTPIFARVAYSSALSVMQSGYMTSARTSGVSTFRATLVHLVPNILSPVLAVATLKTGGNLIVAAALNYFGLGVQPPSPEWGLLIAQSQRYAYSHPELIIIAGLCILITSLGFNLIGDGVRDWLDPR